MPNWCSNNATFTHEDPAQIQRLVKAYNADRLFTEFVPTPAELLETTAPNDKNVDELVEKYGYPDWYSFQVNEWGTKWDVQSVDEVEADGNSVSVFFDSAWAPPIQFYAKMEEQGFTVQAYYYEPGMAFCGSYENGDDNTIEITGNSAWVKENVPNDIDEMFAISESMEQWEEDEQNDA